MGLRVGETKATGDFEDHDPCAIKKPADEGAVSILDTEQGHSKVYIKWYGCSHNRSDAEYIAGSLREKGFIITDLEEEAIISVCVSCTVVDVSESKAYKMVRTAINDGRFAILCGCIPASYKGKLPEEFVPLHASGLLCLVGTDALNSVAEFAMEYITKSGLVDLTTKEFVRRSKLIPLSAPKARFNQHIEIIPIESGCLHACSYCKTKAARGSLRSYPIQEIRDRIASLPEEVYEIWFTGEDTGAWGRDIGLRMIDLIRGVVDVLKKNTKIRIGMTNPPYFIDCLEEWKEIFTHPKVFAFAHIPVQSCSNAVLAAMRRDYTAEDFKTIIDYFQREIPGMLLSTDIIVAYPGETLEDHKATCDMIKDINIACVNITKFYARPGTAAYGLPEIHSSIAKTRTRELTKLTRHIDVNTHLLNTEQEVLIVEVGSKGYVCGRNKNYVHVLVKGDESLIGKTVRGTVTETNRQWVKCETFRIVNE